MEHVSTTSRKTLTLAPANSRFSAKIAKSVSRRFGFENYAQIVNNNACLKTFVVNILNRVFGGKCLIISPGKKTNTAA